MPGRGRRRLRRWLRTAWAGLSAPGLGPETWLESRRIFLALLGVVHLAAFLSLGVQVDGLLGSDGIAPATRQLEEIAARLGGWRFVLAPTLLWIASGDAALHALCAAGAGTALLLVAGVAPRACLAFLFLGYLSFVSIGGIFLRYQWDALLLETTALALFLAPPGVRPSRAASRPVEPIGLWLLRFLLFKLLLLSGAVKLLSGDPAWHGLTAMDFHYWTQPLPAPTSFAAAHLPAAWHRTEVLATFGVELGLAWLVFAPRLPRSLAAAAIVAQQLAISATGNYGFFNLLTIALCVPLVDDAIWRRLLPRRLLGAPADPVRARRCGWPPTRIALAGLAALLLAASAQRALDRLDPSPLGGPVAGLARWLAPFRVANAYGLFAVMTTSRDEIGLEGSNDGESWRPYEFRWKPGPPERRPRFAGLHMPRLDWQMWFAALRSCPDVPWLHAFLWHVLRGDAAVLQLLAENPFPDAPPRYLRTPVASYRFAPPGADVWWVREPRGRYCPTVTLAADRLVTAPTVH